MFGNQYQEKLPLMRNQHPGLRALTTSSLPRAIMPVQPLSDQQPYSLTLTHPRFHFSSKLTLVCDWTIIMKFQGNE